MATLTKRLPHGAKPIGKVSAKEISVIVLNALTADIVVPAGSDYRILYGTVSLASSATAGTRQLELKVINGSATEIMTLSAGVTQSTSITRKYNFLPGSERDTAFINTDEANTPIPNELYLPSGFTLRAEIVSGGDAAADDLTLHFMVEEVEV